MTTFASVVEGDGEVRALPVLIGSLAAAHGVSPVEVPRPFRLSRSEILIPEEFARAVELQSELLAVLRG